MMEREERALSCRKFGCGIWGSGVQEKKEEKKN